MPRQDQTFRFTPEIGARLRELRLQAGLSLVELGHVMGRRPGFQTHLKRLEAGQVRFPSLALVADYLRACRASFADILLALSEYTNRPPVRARRIEERVRAELAPLGGREAIRLGKYDRRRGEQLRPEARVRAAREQARAAVERRLLDRLMAEEVNRLGVQPTMTVRKVAHDYAWMVWKALVLTGPRPKPKSIRGRPRKTRAQRLSEARARILRLAPGILPAKALKQIQDKVILLYEDVRPPDCTQD